MGTTADHGRHVTVRVAASRTRAVVQSAGRVLPSRGLLQLCPGLVVPRDRP